MAAFLLIAVFAFLIHTARESIMLEVRTHALGVAAALATGIAAEDLEAVRGPEQVGSEAFRRVQRALRDVTAMLPDIRYTYTMRPDPRPGAKATDFLYLVDGPASDDNRNGVLEDDERSEAPGTLHDAADYPAMLEALARPAADRMIRPDPPYPDLISGYAPVRDATGRTVGIVGVDITAATVRAKLAGVYAVNLGCGALLLALIALAGRFYDRQQRALEENRVLARELATRNQDLAQRNEQMQAELKLAQQVQLGFLPRDFPRRDRLAFDRFYITSDILGGDLFDVFAIDHDRIGFYMADVAGHGVSAALISGLLKMAVTSIRDPSAPAPDTLHPERVLGRLNDLLRRDLPDCEFITLLYAVLDLRTNEVRLASAGHPPPFIVRRNARDAEVWPVENGLALGLLSGQSYPVATRTLGAGECLLFYTDGLIEAMNTNGEEFGEERSLEVVRRNAAAPPADLLDAIRRAVDSHRAGAAISDDFSLLLCSVT